MFLPVFYVLIAIYLMVRGIREAGFWGNAFVEGVLLFLSGLFLFLEWV